MLTAISSGELSALEKVAEASTERQTEEPRNFDGQYGEYQAKLARIDADIALHEAELKSTQLIVRKLEQTVPIARQRAKDFRERVDKAFISKHGYLEKNDSIL